MICESQLKEPITHEDLLDHEEYLEQAASTIKALFDRCRYQYNGDTPVSTYLWNISARSTRPTRSSRRCAPQTSSQVAAERRTSLGSFS
jgi:hypothetical protein